MSGFLLSPGITPELTDAFVLELPLALALGYFAARGYGLELAFLLNLLALGVVKWITDWSDPLDDVVAASALLGGALWLALLHGRPRRARLRSLLGAVLGPFLVLVGALKLTDFYDPFDLLLADAVVVAGIALWWYRHRSLRESSAKSDMS